MYAVTPIHALAQVRASFWDPGDNGFDVIDAAEIVGLVLAVIGLVTIIAKGVRWLDAKRDEAHQLDVEAIMRPHLEKLHEEMDQQTDALLIALQEATKPIQPGTNGGLSMTDLHLRVGEVAASTARIEDRLEVVEKAQEMATSERASILRIADHNAHAIASAVRQLGGEIADITPLGPDGFPA